MTLRTETRGGFLGEFFASDLGSDTRSLGDIDFGAAPVAREVVSKLDYHGSDPFWEGGLQSYFGARFTGDLVVETAGRYTFRLTSDDGSRLSLGGETVLDHGGLHSASTETVTLDLAAGRHALELLYFEWRGDQTLDLRWSGPDTGHETVHLDSMVLPGTTEAPDPAPDPDPEPEPDPAPDPEPASGPGFLGEFFASDLGSDTRSLGDIDFGAAPVAREVVSKLDYHGSGPFWEGGLQSYFGARFTGDLVVETAGRYTFRLTSDDGSRLSLGGETVLDHGGLHSASTETVTLDLAAGRHALELLYFEWRGDQTLDLRWSGPDTGHETVHLDSMVLPGTTEAPDPAPDPEPDPAPDPAPDPEPDPAPDPEPDPDPEPEPEPGPEPVPGTGGSDENERLDPVDASQGGVAIQGGRVTTLDVSGGRTVADLELLDLPEHGHASVNPDGTIALVLSGDHTYSGPLSLEYRAQFADGSQETATLDLQVTPVLQAKGWGLGEHYMLETDANDDIIVETGDNHRKVHVSESEAALTRADIAALEGMALEDVTLVWIRDHSDYGQSEDTALATDLGLELWQQTLVNPVFGPSSHWLLFEKGYEYTDLGRFMESGSAGESALHPVHITSWGDEGEAVVRNEIILTQDGFENVVVSDLRVTGGINVFDSANILISDTEISDVNGTGINVRFVDGFTLHDSSVSHAVLSSNDGTYWTEWNQGLIVMGSDHVLATGNIFHHNGWEKGFAFENTIDGGVAPNTYKHNVYFQWNTSDVTFNENISTQSSSFGVKLRGGGFAQDNLLADNNVGADMLGGDYKGFGQVGNFTFFADNVITSAGYKMAVRDGAHSWGIQNKGELTTWLDNIIMHLANPDDPDDLAAKPITQPAMNSNYGSLAFDNTTMFNWIGAEPQRWKGQDVPRNIGDADPEDLMQVTPQRYAAQLTNGKVTTIDGLAEYLLSLAPTEYDDTITARDIVEYFQNAFGRTLEGPDAESHRFIPNDLASGMRWDNRVNWSNGETPGAGDSVDLGGNHVHYGTLTTRLGSLTLGDNGHLSVSSGKLGLDGAVGAGEGAGIDISGAGQFWTHGYDGAAQLGIDAGSGRFANTGDFGGAAAIRVGGDAQAILATDGGSMRLAAGSELRIEGSKADVGFDGDTAGPAVLHMQDDARLSFVADGEGFSTIGEFRSGHWDQKGSPVASGFFMDGVLQIDLSGYSDGAGIHELIDVDMLDGSFDEIQLFGLDDGLDAKAVVDYEADMLMLHVSEGSGQLSLGQIGAAAGASLGDVGDALRDALLGGLAIDDLGDLAPGVRIAGSELDDLLL